MNIILFLNLFYFHQNNGALVFVWCLFGFFGTRCRSRSCCGSCRVGYNVSHSLSAFWKLEHRTLVRKSVSLVYGIYLIQQFEKKKSLWPCHDHGEIMETILWSWRNHGDHTMIMAKSWRRCHDHGMNHGKHGTHTLNHDHHGKKHGRHAVIMAWSWSCFAMIMAWSWQDHVMAVMFFQPVYIGL